MTAYVLNELPADVRERLAARLLEATRTEVQILVIEPIARGITPWWDRFTAPFVARGARADEWRFPVELPAPIARLDRSAGLRHDALTARSLYWAPATHPASQANLAG